MILSLLKLKPPLRQGPEQTDVGYEFALWNQAKEADRTVEAAHLQPFRPLRPANAAHLP